MGRPLDITGQKFNMLTALSKTENRTAHGLVIWKFQCDCGKIVDKPAAQVKNGDIKSCGCIRSQGLVKFNKENSDKAKIPYGTIFGKRKVIEDLGFREQVKGHNRRWYRCLCECGNYKEVMGNQLKQGQTSSCGQCGFMSKGEFLIKQLLEENNYIFNYDYMMPELFQETGRRLRFDFIVYNNDNSINRIIEFDGRQHKYGPDTSYWGHTTDTLDTIKERDLIKNNFCKKHNYIFVRIPHTKLNTLSIEDLMSDRYTVKE